jgi:Tfp pilus assembly protein PilO
VDLPSTKEALEVAGVAVGWLRQIIKRVGSIAATQDKHAELLAVQAERQAAQAAQIEHLQEQVATLREAVARLEGRESAERPRRRR